MADPAYDLDTPNPYTGESVNDQLAPAAGRTYSPSGIVPVTDEAGYEALRPGQKYTDPDGVLRQKPVRTAKDYELIAEGQEYTDPDGNVRVKPAYESLNYSAQTLHSMAINAKEQKRALEYAYPDAEITQDADGEWVVNDNGVKRKAGAGRGVRAFLGSATAAAAPTTGAVLGAMGGAVGGSAVPVVGTVAGTAAGGASGALAGQLVNDAIFHAIAGTERTPGEEATNLSLAMLTGGAGAGVGRGAAAFVPSIKAGVSAAGAAAPTAARWAAGATKEGLETAERLGQRGYAVPPSAYAPELPHLQNMAEVLDPAFRTDKPLMKQNYAAYEKDAAKMLNEAGVPEFDDLVKAPSLTNAEAAIPTARVGEKLREKAIQQATEADAKVKAAFDERRAALAAGAPENQSGREAILRAQQESQQAVDNLLNENYARINQDVERAYQLARVGSNTGEAWQQVADRLQATRRALGERASRYYAASHEVGGNTPIESTRLVEAARDFAQSLPEEFRTTQPAVVRRLEAMAGEIGGDGEVIRPPTHPTFAELHEMRSLMRSNADFSRLNSDVRNGTYKHFNNVIDDVIHDAGAQPNLRLAAQILDGADDWYRRNMPIFNARELNAVMRGVEAGEPANPVMLYNTLVKADQPQMTARVRQMVGPNLWSAVQAAQVDDLMRRSMSTSVPGQVDGRAFARNVLADYNNGLIQQVQNREMVDQLMRQVNLLAAADGKIPIAANQGDRMLDVIARARAADAEAVRVARTDPLVALKKEGDRIAREEARAMSRAAAERKREPLGFLFDASVGTQEAANRVLGNPDLLLAASQKFGRDSAEFKLLQQTYLWKVLKGDMNPGKEMAKIAPEIQHIMFPGARLDQLQQLAKDMDFLTNTRLMGGAANDTGGSMMARAKVEHPPQPSVVRQVINAVPGAGQVADFVARSTLQKFYKIAANASTNPALFTFMLKGLRGTAEQRLATKNAIDAVLQRGSAVGAGTGEAMFQGRDIRE